MRVWSALGSLILVCGLVVGGFATSPNTRIGRAIAGVFGNKNSSSSSAALKTVFAHGKEVTVMAVGGSSAQGYDDPHLNGYLSRALASVSSELKIPIRFANEAKSGDIPTMFAPRFDPLVVKVHPKIVILGWGLLNSIAQKVPESMFSRVIRDETIMALKAGASVWVVTPPATLATYVGPEVPLEPKYVNLEMSAATSVHSPNVHVFNLFQAMKGYLGAHHLPYKPYIANKWHLNQTGHILAGRILATLILSSQNKGGLTS